MVSQWPRNLLFQDGALVLLWLITGHGGIKSLATEMQPHTTEFSSIQIKPVVYSINKRKVFFCSYSLSRYLFAQMFSKVLFLMHVITIIGANKEDWFVFNTEIKSCFRFSKYTKELLWCLSFNSLMNEVVHTSPTIGSNVEEIVVKNTHFLMWDIGGQESLRSSWNTYYSNTEVY